MYTHCCWRLSWREHLVSQPGKGHLWLRSPVWTREWRARWPLVVKARSQVGQTCFFFWAGEEALVLEAAGDWEEEVDEEEAGIVA